MRRTKASQHEDAPARPVPGTGPPLTLEQLLAADDLISVTQAAQLAKVHITTIYRWIVGTGTMSPRLRAWKRGAAHLVSRSELLAVYQQTPTVAGRQAPAAETLSRARQRAETDATLREFGLA